jgi:hypothetical protein
VIAFVHAVSAEWLKRKRSLASLMTLIGGFFTPAIVTAVRLMYPDRLPQLYANDVFWQQLWKSSWESMAIFFLPMGAILATSLVTQIEFRNNAWKQVHALPIGLSTNFFSKLLVVLALLAQFLVLFNAGIWLSGVIPSLLIAGVPLPKGPLPLRSFLRADLMYFVDVLPIVAAQYAMSIRFRNFLVAIGTGFVAWVTALAILPSRFNYVFPYTYTVLEYLKDGTKSKAVIPTVNIHWFALAYFAIFTIAGYVLFVTKRQKG